MTNKKKSIELKLHELEIDFSLAINRLSLENYFGDIPDFILANYAVRCLELQNSLRKTQKAWSKQASEDCGLIKDTSND